MFAPDANTKEMLMAILSSIDEGIHVVDQKGRTIFYNEIAAKNDGLLSKEVIGKHLLDVFPSLSRQTSTLLTAMKTGVPIYDQQQTYRNFRGELIDTINTTIPIILNGEIIGAVEIAKDYSTMKRLSEKLIELQAKMNRTKRRGKNILDNEAFYTFQDIITKNEKMNRLMDKAKKVARTTSPIFVFGETGTGKELLVQSIHHASPRKNNPFITQNCAAIPPSLLESTLFGTEKGSFTGSESREGLFELAHGGTLFLDEIHTLPYDLQAKLLRVLDNGIVRRIGSNQNVKTDVRVIVATNETREYLLENQIIRKDLYYRLNVVSFFLPPLRERREDLVHLVNTFIANYNRKFHKEVKGLNKEAMELIQAYDWPGNIRELKHTIEAAMNIVDGEYITKNDLPETIASFAKSETNIQLNDRKGLSLKEIVEEIEKKIILEKLTETNRNINQTAKLLKIPRQTLQYKLKKYNLNLS